MIPTIGASVTIPPLLSALSYLPLWVAVPLFALIAFITWFVWPSTRTVTASDLDANVRASSFAPERLPKHIDTIVIGSGSGGCACANLLARAGQRVLVLEQHPDKTGGCTHSFILQNCEWDTGLHYTAAAMGQRTKRPGALLHYMTAGLQQWMPLRDPYDQVVFPKDPQTHPHCPNASSYDFVTGSTHTVDCVLSHIDPHNTELRQRALEYMKVCSEINSGFTAMGLSRMLPHCLQWLVQTRLDRLYKFASMTVRNVQYAVLNLGYTVDDLLERGCPKAPPGPEPDPSLRRLKAVLTHPIGDYAVQPREATMAAHGVTMAHYMQGACYSVGATQKISMRSTAVVRALGGEALVNATVLGIIIEKGRAVGVRVANTTSLHADQGDLQVTEVRAKNIVCATSVYNLYHKLLPPELPVVQDFNNNATIQQSNGHVFLFCKIRGTPEELGLPTHNLWYFNGYDLDEAFDEYFENPTQVRPPTVYIGFPCTKDPTWKKRFPKISNCILISDGLWEWFTKWQYTSHDHRAPDYFEFKEALTKHLLDILFETVPQVRDKVEFYHLGTPLSEVTYLASWHGGSYGTKCVPSMFDKVNHKWTTTPHTAVPGLYMAGSDAFLPAVCGAMYGGTFGACAVLGHVRTLKLVMHFLMAFASYLREEDPKLGYLESINLAYYKFLND